MSLFTLVAYILCGLVVASCFVFGPYYRDAEQKSRHERFVKVCGLSAGAFFALGLLL